MNLGLLAIKNIRRSPLKTILQIVFLGLVVGATLIDGAVIRGFTTMIERAATRLDIGEFQIHAPGAREATDLYSEVPNAAATMAAAEKRGFHVAPRLYGTALAATNSQTVGVQIHGTDLLREAAVTNLHQHLATGTWLDSGRPTGVVIGRTLAKRLGIKIGDKLILLGQASDGSPASGVAAVLGILRAVSPKIDARAIYMPTAGFRDLFQVPNAVHELALVRANSGEPFATAEARLLGLKPSLPAMGEVHSWRSLNPVLARMIDLQHLGSFVHLLLTYVALSGLIINQRFTSLYDRMHEYGVMIALGMTSVQIWRLIVAEAIVMALAAGLVGLGIGLPAALALQKHGFDYSALIDGIAYAGLSIEPVLHAKVGAWEVVTPLVFLIGAVTAISAVPALVAARMEPLKALGPR